MKDEWLTLLILSMVSLMLCSSNVLWAFVPDDLGFVNTGQVGHSSGKTFTNSIGMKFVIIPAGSFMMGSPSSESGRKSNETQHRVTLTKPFLLQATEVTVGQWRQFVLDTGYQTKAEIEGGAFVARAGEKVGMRKGMNWNSLTDDQSDEHPVTCVSWNDCQAFIEWLNRKEEMKYRLPTEAEWEYACRAGTESAFPWGNDPTEACQFANIADQSLKRASQGTIVSNCDDGYWITAPAGKFKPNNWGLYDMIGNVLEWCSDWGGHYPDVAVKNPEGPSDGSDRILRGGSWGSSAKECRSASRSGFDPDSCHFILGFRLAADL